MILQFFLVCKLYLESVIINFSSSIWGASKRRRIVANLQLHHRPHLIASWSQFWFALKYFFLFLFFISFFVILFYFYFLSYVNPINRWNYWTNGKTRPRREEIVKSCSFWWMWSCSCSFSGRAMWCCCQFHI